MRIDSSDKLLKFPLIHLLTGLEFSRHLLRPSYANPTQQRIRQMCFPRLALITHNHTLDTGWVFSRALRSLHVLPRLTPFICFPALGVECIFPALDVGYKLSSVWRRLNVSRAWRWFYVHPLLSMVPYFFLLHVGCALLALSAAWCKFSLLSFFPPSPPTNWFFQLCWPLDFVILLFFWLQHSSPYNLKCSPEFTNKLNGLKLMKKNFWFLINL